MATATCPRSAGGDADGPLVSNASRAVPRFASTPSGLPRLQISRRVSISGDSPRPPLQKASAGSTKAKSELSRLCRRIWRRRHPDRQGRSTRARSGGPACTFRPAGYRHDRHLPDIEHEEICIAGGKPDVVGFSHSSRSPCRCCGDGESRGLDRDSGEAGSFGCSEIEACTTQFFIWERQRQSLYQLIPPNDKPGSALRLWLSSPEYATLRECAARMRPVDKLQMQIIAEILNNICIIMALL